MALSLVLRQSCKMNDMNGVVKEDFLTLHINNKKSTARVLFLLLAESQGFEPRVGCPTSDFKSGALNRSANSPIGLFRF